VVLVRGAVERVARGLRVAVDHAADAGLVGVEAREQRRARGAAAADVVELSEADAVGGEAVDVERGNLRAVAAEVGEAEIVGEEDDDVRARRGVDGAGGR
jgi:hypothetical protein